MPQRRGSELPMNARRLNWVTIVPPSSGPTNQPLLVIVRGAERTVGFEFRILSIKLSQQGRIRLWAQIGQQSLEAAGPDLEARAVRFHEDCFADERVHQPDLGVSLDHQDPSLLLRVEFPIRIRRQVDPLKNEMRAGDEQGSGIGQTARN